MLGKYTAEFEEKIADYCGRKYACVVGSGTVALEIVYKAIFGLGQHIVGIPDYSYMATRNSVMSTGNIARYFKTDDNGRLNYIPDNCVGIVTAVNLYGHMLDYDQLFEGHSKIIIEDAAQSLGASYKGKKSGSFGQCSVLSFDPMKNLPCFGSGGMILCDDKEIYDNVKKLRRNSLDNQRSTNSVMSELQCAEMLVKLKYFDSWQADRQRVAKEYMHKFDKYGIKYIAPIQNVDTVSSWHKFVIVVPDRNVVVEKLKKHNVDYRIHYDYMLTHDERNMLCDHSISLPIYHNLRTDWVDRVFG